MVWSSGRFDSGLRARTDTKRDGAEPGNRAENVVIVAGAAFTVLFVSSVAVLMYLA